MGNKAKGRAPKTVKMEASGGGKGNGCDPQVTITGPGDKGNEKLPQSIGHAKVSDTDMPNAKRQGEVDTSKGYTTLKNSTKTGETDF
jgi:hypothetical protein